MSVAAHWAFGVSRSYQVQPCGAKKNIILVLCMPEVHVGCGLNRAAEIVVAFLYLYRSTMSTKACSVLCPLSRFKE